MQPLRPITDFAPLDEQGFILNVARTELIVQPWSTVIEDLRIAYQTHYEPHLHSVYVRGSVANGTAIRGLSDVDTFAIVSLDRRSIDLSWRDAYVSKAIARFPFLTTVELNVVPLAALRVQDQYARARFTLKTQSVCIHGPDIGPTLSPYRIDDTIIFYAPRIESYIEIARRHLSAGFEPGEVCRWIMKAVLRSGFDMVMLSERRYTRDLYRCYTIFSQHYPAQEPLMRRALELVLDPPRDPRDILGLLDRLGPWLVAEAKAALMTQSPPG